MAVSQGIICAAIEGFQSGGGGGALLALIKSEYSTTVTGNNTWPVIINDPEARNFVNEI